MLRISGRVEIPLEEVQIKAMRAQGSGGQHVNKVSTAIQLFFDIRASSLPEHVKARLLEMSDHRITGEGVVIIKSQESRSQEANKEAAFARLVELLKSGCVLPKKRRPTKRTKGSNERRLKGKSLKSRTKSLRGRGSVDSH